MAKTTLGERIRKTADRLLDAFQSGQIPEKLATVFFALRDDIDRPSDVWSHSNRVIALTQSGHVDCRGFKQWKAVSRSVKKGSKAAYILGPKMVKREDPETAEETTHCVGFYTIPVFGYDQTEGEPIIEGEREFLESLPLMQVARRWGVEVRLDTGEQGLTRGFLGSTNGRDRITLAVDSLKTWCHELVHVADSRLSGGLKPGQHVDQEIVAELGAATLLTLLGHENQADTGRAYEYIKRYAEDDHNKALRLCNRYIERTCKAIEEILKAADEVEPIAELLETFVPAPKAETGTGTGTQLTLF